MVDVGVVQEVVRHSICMSNTVFNVSQWIGRTEESEGIPITRTLSHDSRSTDVAGSVPSSPRPAAPQQQIQPQQPEVFEAKEVAQQQHSAVRITPCN